MTIGTLRLGSHGVKSVLARSARPPGRSQPETPPRKHSKQASSVVIRCLMLYRTHACPLTHLCSRSLLACLRPRVTLANPSFSRPYGLLTTSWSSLRWIREIGNLADLDRNPPAPILRLEMKLSHGASQTRVVALVGRKGQLAGPAGWSSPFFVPASLPKSKSSA